MPTRFLRLTIALFAAAAAGRAGTIFLSGDINIGNGIDGSNGAPVGDNGMFFSNVLGAGTKVVFQEGLGEGAPAADSISTWYTSHGKTVDAITGDFTSSDLAGASLLISALPLASYSTADITLMQGFLSAGNTVFFIGEFSAFSTYDTFINMALSALGSEMVLEINNVDDGFHTATGGQIASNPLTVGVNNFVYGAVSEVLGGTPLILDSSSQAFVAVEGPEPSTTLFVLGGLLALIVLQRRGVNLRS